MPHGARRAWSFTTPAAWRRPPTAAPPSPCGAPAQAPAPAARVGASPRTPWRRRPRRRHDAGFLRQHQATKCRAGAACPRAGVPLFLAFVPDWGRADAPDACRSAEAAAIERPVDTRLCDRGSTPLVGRLRLASWVGTVGMGIASAWLVGRGLPTFGDGVTVPIRPRHSHQAHGISRQRRKAACHMAG